MNRMKWLEKLLSKMGFFIMKIINEIEDYVFSRSFYVSVTLTSFLLAVPLVGVWFLFDLMFYLPPI